MFSDDRMPKMTSATASGGCQNKLASLNAWIIWAVIGVSVTPGQRALTLMRSLSYRIFLVGRKRPCMACFEVWYRYRPGLSRKALTLESRVKVLSCGPCCLSRKNTAAMRAKCKAPKTFTSRVVVLPGSPLTVSTVRLGSNQLPCSKMPAQEMA